MTDVRAANLAAVRMVCERWHTMSRTDYRACFAPASIYVNMPRPESPRIGPDATFDALEPWRERCKIELHVLHLQGDETVMMCERLEYFSLRADGRKIELYVTGVFEMDHGKIVQWRDYYEAAQAPSVLFAAG